MFHLGCLQKKGLAQKGVLQLFKGVLNKKCTEKCTFFSLKTESGFFSQKKIATLLKIELITFMYFSAVLIKNHRTTF